MSLTLKEVCLLILKSNKNEKLSAHDIATLIFLNNQSECQSYIAEKRRNTTQEILKIDDNALINQIKSEIKPDIFKKSQEVKVLAEKPRKFYYTNLTDEQEILEKKENDELTNTIPHSQKDFSEHDLYPLLERYLKSLSFETKRINEKTSANRHGKDGNKWLHPDLVAIQVLNDDWENEIKKMATANFAPEIKIWSFEVKKIINRANIRESFFQTVSNSSWANCSYLVATELNDEAKAELKILSSLHGVGFILLDRDNPEESEIVFSATERTSIDWDNTNRLYTENEDFKKFIETINKCRNNKNFKDFDKLAH